MDTRRRRFASSTRSNSLYALFSRDAGNQPLYPKIKIGFRFRVKKHPIKTFSSSKIVIALRSC